MADINALLNAIKGQQQTLGNPAAQAAAGNRVTSLQNAPAPAEPNPNLLSAIAKIKQAHGVPLEAHEAQILGVPVHEAAVIPYTPDHVKAAIHYGLQNGHEPMHILQVVHHMLSPK